MFSISRSRISLLGAVGSPNVAPDTGTKVSPAEPGTGVGLAVGVAVRVGVGEGEGVDVALGGVVGDGVAIGLGVVAEDGVAVGAGAVVGLEAVVGTGSGGPITITGGPAAARAGATFRPRAPPPPTPRRRNAAVAAASARLRPLAGRAACRAGLWAQRGSSGAVDVTAGLFHHSALERAASTASIGRRVPGLSPPGVRNVQ